MENIEQTPAKNENPGSVEETAPAIELTKQTETTAIQIIQNNYKAFDVALEKFGGSNSQMKQLIRAMVINGLGESYISQGYPDLVKLHGIAKDIDASRLILLHLGITQHNNGILRKMISDITTGAKKLDGVNSDYVDGYVDALSDVECGNVYKQTVAPSSVEPIATTNTGEVKNGE